MLASPTEALAAKEALSDALTIEGLLFVAFSLSYSLAGGKPGGRHPFFTQGWFGWLVVLVIAFLAAAAAAAWWEIFHDDWPDRWSETLTAFGLLVGIAVQPIFAFIINTQAAKE